MAKPKPDLARLMAAEEEQKTEPAEKAAPKAKTSKPSHQKPNVRTDYARVSVYLPPAVAKELKLVAFTHEKKVHDVVLEGIDLVLKSYGRASIEELSGKE